MSCEECEKRQRIEGCEQPYDITDFFPVYFYRVGTGNVAVVCCEEHFKMLRDQLREKKVE